MSDCQFDDLVKRLRCHRSEDAAWRESDALIGEAILAIEALRKERDAARAGCYISRSPRIVAEVRR